MQVILDGRTCQAQIDQTILDVAKANNISIPTLCYLEATGGYGACRLCVVEVVQGGPSGLHSSCTLPVMPGMEILTASERVLRARRITIELLLARAPRSSIIRSLAAQLGIEDTDLVRGNELCVLCGRCVSTCAALGIHAIDFAWRGMKRSVVTPFDSVSEVCIACRACFHVCPTGAIEATVLADKIEVANWKVQLKKVPCSRCGKPYVPARTWRHVQDKQPAHLRNEEIICPQCRLEQALESMTLTDNTCAGTRGPFAGY